MIEENPTENFINFLNKNYNLPVGMIGLAQSYIAVLGEPIDGDCDDGYFVRMTWDGEDDDRLVECLIYDEDNVEFTKVVINEDEFPSEESLIDLRDWLDGYD